VGFEPYGPAINAPAGASIDYAVVEAAYRTLRHYFSSIPTLVASCRRRGAKTRIEMEGSLAHDLVDELHLLLYPLTLGSGKRVLPTGVQATFGLTSATPYPSGVVGLHYARQRGTA
jgi:hypothetical protein